MAHPVRPPIHLKTHFENVNTEFVIKINTSMILFKQLWYSMALICSDACMEDSRTIETLCMSPILEATLFYIPDLGHTVQYIKKV